MLIAPTPGNESDRLQALYRYEVLDTPAELDYERVSHIASQLCHTPIAMVSFIDRDRQWVKSAYGITIDTIPREVSLCAHTVAGAEPLHVPDTTHDDRFADNPAVTGPPNIIFYAGFPLRSTEGLAIGSLCVIDHYPRQLTESQALALQALADQVGLLLELRLTNNQLEQARLEAEELARQKAQLLATLSHEIRTPLHALEGYTQQVLDQHPRPDQQNSLHHLQSIGRTLVSLVNNILDYSKLQANKLLLESLPFSVRTLIQHAIDINAWQASQKKLSLVAHIDDAMPDQLLGDATRLLQVLLNLLGNALKFTEKGEVCVHAYVLEHRGTDLTLSIEVSDTGIGIAPLALASLFNEYTQVSAATSRLYGGSGLGLAISRQLVDLMGGKLVVQSQEGRGSRFGFQLTMPVYEAPTPCGLSDWTRGRLLGVDDSLFNTKMLEYLVAQEGGQIDTFTSPLDALEAARQTDYCGALLDLNMPDLDGYEMAKQLAVIQPGMPLIAVSADDSDETVERTRQAGFSGYLRKPFLPGQLLQILVEVVQQPH
ncbi:hypothetical protein GCM10027578_25430 [Spirosoma luteolum]